MLNLNSLARQQIRQAIAESTLGDVYCLIDLPDGDSLLGESPVIRAFLNLPLTGQPGPRRYQPEC